MFRIEKIIKKKKNEKKNKTTYTQTNVYIENKTKKTRNETKQEIKKINHNLNYIDTNFVSHLISTSLFHVFIPLSCNSCSIPSIDQLYTDKVPSLTPKYSTEHRGGKLMCKKSIHLSKTGVKTPWPIAKHVADCSPRFFTSPFATTLTGLSHFSLTFLFRLPRVSRFI